MTAPKMSEVFELPLYEDDTGTYALANDCSFVAQARRIHRDAIVRAVNAHDALVEAIKRQCDNIKHWLETGEAASPEESESIYDQMRAALALAEGKP